MDEQMDEQYVVAVLRRGVIGAFLGFLNKGERFNSREDAENSIRKGMSPEDMYYRILRVPEIFI